MVPDKTFAIRNGRIVQLNATEIVSGDLLLLRLGDKIAADARLITGNRFTEYLIVPLYFIYPVLLIRSSGGNDHNVSKAEYSYICRQASLLRLMKEKDCKLIENQKSERGIERC